MAFERGGTDPDGEPAAEGAAETGWKVVTEPPTARPTMGGADSEGTGGDAA